MSILQEKNGADPELLVYTVTLINKVQREDSGGEPRVSPQPLRPLSPGLRQPESSLLTPQTLAALPDQDSFYDVTDALEQQGMEALVHRHLSTAGTDVDLRTQLVLYEVGQRAGDKGRGPPEPTPLPWAPPRS